MSSVQSLDDFNQKHPDGTIMEMGKVVLMSSTTEGHIDGHLLAVAEKHDDVVPAQLMSSSHLGQGRGKKAVRQKIS